VARHSSTGTRHHESARTWRNRRDDGVEPDNVKPNYPCGFPLTAADQLITITRLGSPEEACPSRSRTTSIVSALVRDRLCAQRRVTGEVQRVPLIAVEQAKLSFKWSTAGVDGDVRVPQGKRSELRHSSESKSDATNGLQVKRSRSVPWHERGTLRAASAVARIGPDRN
jgi:hypothetical protein